MADLEGTTIAATYRSLLNVGTSANQELDGTPRVIEDGAGNDSVLYLATDSALISGNGTKLYFFDADGDEHISADNAGNLTIGAGNDIVLDAGSSGSVYAAGAAGTSNTAFGDDSGIALTGNYNTLYGSRAGAALAGGGNNVAMGRNALATHVGGSYNIAIGVGAMGDTDGNSGVNIDDSLGNVLIGEGAGGGAWGGSAAINYTVGVGYQALNGALTSAAIGSVAVGYRAGKTLTSGAGNVAVGYEALDYEDDGNYNTAVGYQALTGQQGGANNTVVGYQAANSNGSGEQNTIIGVKAMYSDDDQDGTTAIGYNALYSQNGSSGVSGNTAVGAEAGYYNVDGAGNTYIGSKCGVGASGNSNSYNTGVGSNTLLAITDGDDNVAVGRNAGTALTEGHRNTLLGKGAGAAITTEDDCVLIGRQAGTLLTTTNANATVAVGTNALGALLSGNSNVAVGPYALDAMSIGDNNTAVGIHAGGALDTSDGNDDNTFIGAGAGINATDVDQSTLIGYSSGRWYGGGTGNNATGRIQHCTFVGSQTSGSSNTPTNQTVIGEDATGQADNSVTLGNTSVTAVYAAQDSGAVVYCANVICKVNSAGSVNGIQISGDDGSNDGGSEILLQYNDNQKWKFIQRNQTSIGTAHALQVLDADNDDGVYINQGGSGWTDASDERLKTSIVEIESAVDKLNTLQAVNFKWKYGSEERQAKNNLGLLAQEVYKVFPEAVDYHDPEKFKLIDHPTIEGTKQAQEAWGIDKSKLIPVLVKAVQELSSKNEALEARVKALEDA